MQKHSNLLETIFGQSSIKMKISYYSDDFQSEIWKFWYFILISSLINIIYSRCCISYLTFFLDGPLYFILVSHSKWCIISVVFQNLADHHYCYWGTTFGSNVIYFVLSWTYLKTYFPCLSVLRLCIWILTDWGRCLKLIFRHYKAAVCWLNILTFEQTIRDLVQV